MTEFAEKQDRTRAMLAARDLDAIVMQRASSFAWATCGASSYINTASTTGLASLLITPGNCYVLADNIETPRLEKEEGLAAQGWTFRTYPWYHPPDVVGELTQGLRLGADGPYPGATDLSNDMARLRSRLLPEEIQRARALGAICAEAMDTAIHAVKPGMTEYEIASLLAVETERRGAQAIVNLIATDGRIFNYRHPLPAGRTLQKYAMLILCGRRNGLVISLTRLLHFGKLPDDLRRKMEATATVDAAYIAGTQPGRTLAEVFQDGVDAYVRTGFPEEWQLHHQGGPAGYEPREFLATPFSEETLVAGEMFAWNPSITGTKSEDTTICGEGGDNQVITTIPGWPMLDIDVNGKTVPRPSILEVY